MVVSKEFRRRAWESLKGKYWVAFLASLIVSLFTSLSSTIVSIPDIKRTINAINNSIILGQPAPGARAAISLDVDKIVGEATTNTTGLETITWILFLLITLLLLNPLNVGLNNYFIKNTQTRPELKEIFSGFKNGYSSNIVTMFLVDIKIFLWTLLFIIPGIIKSYEYAMVPYILADEPGTYYSDAFLKSKKMMTGNKWRLFKLQFSFIGWYLLSLLTFGIGMVFLSPYYAAAQAEFYNEMKMTITE